MLRQEIEELHDKVDTEESRTSKLEEKLKRSKTESVLHSQRICDLSKEQEIGKSLVKHVYLLCHNTMCTAIHYRMYDYTVYVRKKYPPIIHSLVTE